jgi:hypothetical protein
MMLWRKRFQREWGEPARYIWKLEFQRRGAPHIHLWMAPPHAVRHSVEVVYVERGGCELLRTDCGLAHWRAGRLHRWLMAFWSSESYPPDPATRAPHSNSRPAKTRFASHTQAAKLLWLLGSQGRCQVRVGRFRYDQHVRGAWLIPENDTGELAVACAHVGQR